jgi:tetratricopeptide (TPR) repeat protein
MSAHTLAGRFARAELLYQQARYELAVRELRQIIALAPENPSGHALMALCLVELQHFEEAQREAELSVGQGPDFAFGHYALARVLEDRRDFDGAARAVGEAIRIEPADADFHALHAQIRFNRHEWPLALAAAETGLQFDPEHIAANNLRAMALVKLGRKTEAGQTIESTLAHNPENSFTHANRGWTLLESGDRQRALEHFQESLRLDPTNDWARAGIVEALKAGNPIYAFILRYFLWMQKLSQGAQWAVILGGYAGNRLLGVWRRANPEVAPWILPLQIAYFAFVLLTWLAQPLFNLLLRLNRYGRLALSEEQIRASNWVGGCLLLSLLAVGGGLVLGFPVWLLLLALVGVGVSLPVSAVFDCQPGWPRRTMALYAGAMALVGLLAVAAVLGESAGARGVNGENPGFALLGLFGIGFFLNGFIANILMSRHPRR